MLSPKTRSRIARLARIEVPAGRGRRRARALNRHPRAGRPAAGGRYGRGRAHVPPAGGRPAALRADAVTEPTGAPVPGDRAGGRGRACTWCPESDRVGARFHARRAAAALPRGACPASSSRAPCLERIAAPLNGALNAFITVDERKSLAQARAADERIARGEAQPLTGIPVAHKDLFCARGWRTTCGSKMLANFVSPYDAHVIEQFDARGRGAAGQDQHGRVRHGLVQRELVFRPGAQPLGRTRVPGGSSSGGSAAAVAARMAPAATGTDTGGSIRQPAALHRRVRPETDLRRVSRYGMVAFASSLDQGGALATLRRGPGDDARRHGRARRARLDLPGPAEGGLRARSSALG
jgi:hypothetical protein